MTGLTLGHEYACSVAAKNGAGSTTTHATVVHDRPMTSPDVPAAISTTAFDTYQTWGGTYDISWPAATPDYSSATGGDAGAALVSTLSWDITLQDGSHSPQSGTSGPLPPGQTDFPNVPAIDNATYAITLKIDNTYTLAGLATGPTSPAATFHSLGYPTAQPTLSLPSGANVYGSAVIGINGSPVPAPQPSAQLVYRIYDGDSQVAETSTSPATVSLPVGPHTIKVDACYKANSDGNEFCASQSPTKAIAMPSEGVYVSGPAGQPGTPSGPPSSESTSASQVDLTWTWQPPAPTSDGCNGCGIAYYLVNVSTGTDTSACQSWTRHSDGNGTDTETVNNASPGGSVSYRLQVVAVNNAVDASGVHHWDCGDAVSSGATTISNPPPPEPIGVIRNSHQSTSVTGCTKSCYWLTLQVSNLTPGRTYYLSIGNSSCSGSKAGGCWGSYAAPANGSGVASIPVDYFAIGICDNSEFPIWPLLGTLSTNVSRIPNTYVCSQLG
jgi:hypothetical protein